MKGIKGIDPASSNQQATSSFAAEFPSNLKTFMKSLISFKSKKSLPHLLFVYIFTLAVFHNIALFAKSYTTMDAARQANLLFSTAKMELGRGLAYSLKEATDDQASNKLTKGEEDDYQIPLLNFGLGLFASSMASQLVDLNKSLGVAMMFALYGGYCTYFFVRSNAFQKSLRGSS
jgi:hypothetical protein